MRSLFTVAVSVLVVLGGSAAAQGQCESTPPQPCPNCFAVFVMPDTQHYTNAVARVLATASQGILCSAIVADRQNDPLWVMTSLPAIRKTTQQGD
jgi:hypothetical protein